MDDAAIHGISRDADYWSLRFLVHSGSPRAFSPRDDNTLLSLRRGRQDDAAIHRVSVKAFDLSLRFLVHSGSPGAHALAMTK